MPGETLTLDIVANDNATPGIKRVADQTERLSTELQALIKATRRLDDVFKRQSATTTSVVREEARLTASRAKLTRATAQEIAAERKLNAERAKTDKVSSGAGNQGVLNVLNKLTGGLAGATAQYGALGPAAAAAAVGVTALNAAVDVSISALKLQAQFLAQSVTQALAFEQEITRVTAVVGGGSAAFEQLRAAALAGGASTLFTAQQAAEALRFLGQAGLSASEAAAALPGSLQLAAAGGLDLAKAADIATNILSGFQLEVDQLNRVNDVLVLGANRSNTSVQELGTAFSYAAGVANATGNELEDVAAIFQVLANNGIKASRAGTAVATGISRLQKPTPEAAAALEKLGISLTNAEGKTKPLIQVLRELETQGATTRDILTIFGQVAGTKLLTVLNTGTAAVDRYAEANRRAAGSAAEFQRVLQDTASAQAQIFQSTIETLSITIGSEFLPNVKGVSQALTEQANIALNNNQVLGEFAQISDAATRSLAALLRISADIVPPLIRLGGVVLTVAQDLDKITYVIARLPIFLPFTIWAKTAGSAAASISSLNDTMDATNVIAEETRLRLLGAADGVGEVNTASVKGRRALLEASTAAKRFAIEVGLIEPPQQMATLTQLVTQLTTGYKQAAAAARVFAGLGGGNATVGADPVDAEIAGKREVAKLEANIALATDERQRAQLQFELEILKIRSEGLDTEIQLSKELEALGKLQARERALDASAQRGRKKARGEDISGRLEELRIGQLILQTEDRSRLIQLKYEQDLARINASKDKQAVKDAQAVTAGLERDRAQLELSRQIYQEQVAGDVEALRLRAQLIGAGGELVAIDLERQAALKALAADQSLSDEVRALKEAAILAEAEKKTREQQLGVERQLFAQEQAATALQVDRLSERKDAESQIAVIRLQSSERLRQIALDEEDATIRTLKLRREQEDTERKIADVRIKAALAQTEDVRQRVSAGFGTDTGGLQSQFAAEAQLELDNRIQSLEVAKQAAELRGQDTEFLTKRIEGLRAEAEAERAVAAATIARVEATGQLISGVTDLSTKLADVATLGFDSAAGYEATAAAISTAAGLGGALAQGLGVSAKTAAKIQAAFNAAAAIGSFAAYAASGFTAANFLTSSIQYGIAAAKFGVIAGVSSGAGAGRGGGGGGAGASGVTTPTFNAAAERDKTAQAFAKALRDQLEKPVQNVINLDFRRATLLESTPAVGREISSAVGAAQASVYQSGQRGPR